MTGEEREPPTTVIAPKSGWRWVDGGEVRAFKDLLYFLVWRDVKVLYKQTVLGFGWAILRPFFSMVVFSVIFGGLASVPSDGVPYPIFTFAALVPWTYFAAAVTGATNSLVTNVNMLTKVYFPRVFLPLTPVLAGMVDFGIALVMLGGLMLWYGIAPTAAAVLLPAFMVLMVLTAAGLGFWLAALNVQFRDVRHASTFLMQLLMYAAPVVWPVSLITERFPDSAETVRLLYGLYPMAGVIEGFRTTLLGTGPVPWDLLASGTVGALVLFFTGTLYFRRTERTFADVA